MSVFGVSRPRVRDLAAVLVALGGCAPSFETIRTQAMIHSGEIVELRGDGRNAVLVAPQLQGRVLTSRVGAVESVGYVRLDEIATGNARRPFNNHGGQDRLWLGPEAGKFGFYFEPGAALERKLWRVPKDLNDGAMEIRSRDERHIKMGRDVQLANALGTTFKLRLEREVGLVPAQKLNEEIGVPLPDGVEYIGSYSLNTVTNLAEQPLERDKGLVCVWVLGMFNAAPRALVIAPFRKDEPGGAELGPKFNDDYFDRVSQSAPERLKLVDDAVIFRADGRREAKIGLAPQRTTGYAGSWDPDRKLLVIVKFEYHPEEPLHASFSWKADEPRPWSGDVFQTYNADSTQPGGERNGFYELESASPCRELKGGESLIHRHATFCFQGDPQRLKEIARAVLGVDLDTAVREMLGS